MRRCLTQWLFLGLLISSSLWTVLLRYSTAAAETQGTNTPAGPTIPWFLSPGPNHALTLEKPVLAEPSSPFDLRQIWIRADLRVRPEWRNGACFGGGPPVSGVCNGLDESGSGTTARSGPAASDFYIQQWMRVGLGYDPTPNLTFFVELQDSATWGGNGDPLKGNDAGTPPCATQRPGLCRLGLRTGYLLLRNLAGIEGLSTKLGRQYLVFGNQRLFGHFDWANTGYSHDGVLLSYAGQHVDSKIGWFRHAETDLGQGDPGGSLSPNVLPCEASGVSCGSAPDRRSDDAGRDVDMVLLYNQVRSLPGLVLEPYYVFYSNRLPEQANPGSYLPKSSNQLRHMVGLRTEWRRGNWDLTQEAAYQFGRMADGLGFDDRRNLNINAWASGTWIGYTWYDLDWKPRVAFGFDYASGDGDSNCVTPSGGQARSCGGNANTFENFFPTNFLHVGFMLNGAWRNTLQAQINIQFRPSTRDHIELWALRKCLASARDNWYRGSQSPLIFSRADNVETHVGDEIDFAWTRMFADGKVSFTAMVGHFFPGPYVFHQLGRGSDQDWGILQLWTNF
ncbi:MAG: alginate export family protein [Nitrospiraceae bacterium]|nr:alginate export family protein [Nitrospiraceae bacterium]